MTAVSGPPLGGRIVFIGAGHVGATAAYAMMLRALFAEIVLIDSDEALAEAEATDLSDANALARPTRIRAGGYQDAADAQIAVLTAGAASHDSEPRLALAARSAIIVVDCTRRLAAAGFGGVLVVASNPVDLMTALAQRYAGLPVQRVIGTGTLLDTSRLRQRLAEAFGISASAVDGYVIGEHGDSEVPIFSSVRIGGQPLAEWPGGDDAPVLAAIGAEVRDAGYGIIRGKGYTSFGVATAIVRICEAVIRNERSVLPVSTRVARGDGLRDVCFSVPCVIGANGIERRIEPVLDTGEAAALRASATLLNTALDALDRTG